MTDQLPIIVEVEGVGELEFPDGTDPAVIQQTVRRLVAGGNQPPEHPHARVARMVKENLPSIGGALAGSAGAIGGPFVAAGLAGLGGAGGRFLQQAIDQRGVNVPEAATDAAVQAALQGGGSAISAGAKKLYGGLLRVKDAVAASHPTVVADLIRDVRPITQGARRRTIGELSKIGGQKKAVLQAADATGATIPRETLRSGLDDVLDDVVQRSATPVKEMQTLAKVERELLPDEAVLSPSRADAVKSSLQQQAERGYRQQAMGQRVSDTPMKGRVAVAGKAKTAVEGIVPAVKPLNARYATVKGESKALRDALKREGNTNLIGGTKDLWGLAGAGAGYAASGGDPETAAKLGILARLLATPSTGSMAAIGLDRLGRATPNLLRLLMASHDSGPDR